MKRLDQPVLIGTFVCFSWLAMQAVHEAGHVLGALVTGGRVVRVVLHPLVLSRTDVEPNPAPLLVVWAGPVLGVFVPLLALSVSLGCRFSGTYLFRFFAGFCLVANGVYIGQGSLSGVGDAGDMLGHGSPCWQLVAFGVLAVSCGMCLWNGLGPKFGLGLASGKVSRRAATASAALLCLVIAAELVFRGGG